MIGFSEEGVQSAVVRKYGPALNQVDSISSNGTVIVGDKKTQINEHYLLYYKPVVRDVTTM